MSKANWSNYVWQPKATFSTEPLGDVPEIRGFSCYFRPERLEWCVTPLGVSVLAVGPATRATYRSGEFRWNVEGYRPEALPEWIEVPHDLIAVAKRAVSDLALPDRGILATERETR